MGDGWGTAVGPLPAKASLPFAFSRYDGGELVIGAKRPFWGHNIFIGVCSGNKAV